MRRSRSLTRAEQWELIILLILFVLIFLGLTAAWKSAVPRLFAMATGQTSPAALSAAQDEAAPQVTEILPDSLAPVSQEVIQEEVTELLPAEDTPPPAPPRTVTPARKPAPPAPEIRWYNGKKFVYHKTIKMRVTAYAPDPRCCWPYPGTTTASGLSVKTNGGRLVAADTRVIPFHSLVSIPGYHSGQTVPVLDRGGAIKGNRLDVLLPTYSQAKKWGSKIIDVKVYRPVK